MTTYQERDQLSRIADRYDSEMFVSIPDQEIARRRMAYLGSLGYCEDDARNNFVEIWSECPSAHGGLAATAATSSQTLPHSSEWRRVSTSGKDQTSGKRQPQSLSTNDEDWPDQTRNPSH